MEVEADVADETGGEVQHAGDQVEAKRLQLPPHIGRSRKSSLYYKGKGAADRIKGDQEAQEHPNRSRALRVLNTA